MLEKIRAGQGCSSGLDLGSVPISSSCNQGNNYQISLPPCTEEAENVSPSLEICSAAATEWTLIKFQINHWVHSAISFLFIQLTNF
ncbi:hypothetical protein Y1Q_0002069 [Alligator mississippiensis]|uniref:Uncharacterized protein n=1 Tax=Alligator mississippiensis TaxID=8496 RepID=A0A151MIT9_ALLMI|nr:hypothetical protein Y1Q_0002069 [Alligator mississippiensis]